MKIVEMNVAEVVKVCTLNGKAPGNGVKTLLFLLYRDNWSFQSMKMKT